MIQRYSVMVNMDTVNNLPNFMNKPKDCLIKCTRTDTQPLIKKFQSKSEGIHITNENGSLRIMRIGEDSWSGYQPSPYPWCTSNQWLKQADGLYQCCIN